MMGKDCSEQRCERVGGVRLLQPRVKKKEEREFLRKDWQSRAQLQLSSAAGDSSLPLNQQIPPALEDLSVLFKVFAGERGILKSLVHYCKVTPVLVRNKLYV